LQTSLRQLAVAEFEAIVAEANALGCSPKITNNQGDGCWAEPLICSIGGSTCSSTRVQAERYWSVSPVIGSPQAAWSMRLDDGEAYLDNRT
jgi:hypothetical protein